MLQSSEPRGPVVLDVPEGDVAFRRALQQRLLSQTKPPGSLGMLEDIGLRLGLIQRTLTPKVERTRICVFAGSHGVAREGVSAYPVEVTGQMVANFLNGGAAVCVLARAVGASLHIVDVGVDADFSESFLKHPSFFPRRIKRGTESFAMAPAMLPSECTAALEVGREQARLAAADSIDALGIGEMGIGNSTSAAALCAALLPADAASVTGLGTGVDSEGLARKLAAIRAGLALHTCEATGPEAALHWLAAVGGLEIAALTGCLLEGARLRLPVVVDGFIATAAALVAAHAEPGCLECCFFAHQSAEAGHHAVLAALEVRPMHQLEMRLGEASGAALALPLLRAAARLLTEMATFEAAGVSGAQTGSIRL